MAGSDSASRRKRSARSKAAPVAAAPPGRLQVPEGCVRVVGIGASAGGLEALEQFFGAMPADSGMAFVVVQHLDPTQKALLPQLLQRATAMPVQQATQGVHLAPDGVYVIPPGCELSLVGDALRLEQPVEPRGLRLPVNVLFSSLASERGEQAIAVVLSGMGADGSLGMQAIKAAGGLTAAQDPVSAQFDAMPRNAIATGCVDIVEAADDLPGRILDVATRSQVAHVTASDAAAVAGDHPPFERIIDLLRRRTRHDFSLYKASTLERRVERRMAIHDIESVDGYADFIEHNTQETDLLFKELLIGVTGFFRDAPVWDYLAETALPELLARTGDAQPLRVWSIGCSTGEEAYSLAMLFCEAFERLPKPQAMSLQIFATDISPDAIALARRGRYPLTIADSVSPQRLATFFDAHQTYYEVRKCIRDLVLFAQHDVVLDPPFTRIDLLVCRNLLIYFVPELQRRLLPLFHYSLRRGGMLLLGSSETIGRFAHLFSPVQSRLRLYARQDDVAVHGPDLLLNSFPPLISAAKDLPMPSTDARNPSADGLQKAADAVLLGGFAPAAVVINGDGDIVYISGRTGKYLEPAAGKANWSIHAMARDGLREALSEALRLLPQQREPLQL
ncbi:MAG TPA: chemotaxis protein CheB, partial [Arenimonas sp.]|nr:chemotaxis protein CheB [Arenimonas sp.]